MRNHKPKKLILKTETLKLLTESNLDRVRGALAVASLSGGDTQICGTSCGWYCDTNQKLCTR